MGNASDNVSFQLDVSRDELLSSLALIVKLRRLRNATWVNLSYAEGELVFHVSRLSTRMSAEGDWPGTVKIRVSELRRLALSPPSADPVMFRYSGGLVKIGDMVLPAAGSEASR